MLQRTIPILLMILLFAINSLPLSAADKPETEARRLINALGCKGCHKLQGEGGSLAPELDHIGSRMTRDQISKHLADHSTPRPKGFMPSYKTTSQAELKLLSDFLYHLQ